MKKLHAMVKQVSEKISQLPTAFSSLFEKLGRSFHFTIENHKDLRAVLDLDEALWIATTAPVSTLKADPVFLELLDSDQDERIRAEEIKDGIRFLFKHLSDPSVIRPNNLCLSLATIDTTTELGEKIRFSAGNILNRLQANNASIDLQQIRTAREEVLKGGLDQAGIVLPGAASDITINQYIEDIVKTVGGREHQGGKIGVDADNVAEFMAECRQYLDWWLAAGEVRSAAATTIFPLGDRTADGYAVFHSLIKKFMQYFLLCDIKKLNPELLSQAMETPEGNFALNIFDVEQAQAYLKNAPLGRLNSDGILDPAKDLNPYFHKTIEQFFSQVVKPLLGRDMTTIDKDAVQSLQEIFAPYRAWSEKKPSVRVSVLEPEIIQKYLSDNSYRRRLEALIEESHRTAFVLENIRELERLVLYQAYMLPLVNSFVSCPTLYDPQQRAVFEQGTLVMDGRHFTFAVKVDDREQHIEISKGSNIFVIYCELFHADGQSSCEIAVPVTSGNRGNIHLHTWGIFNDIDGNELHAKVIDIVENPISVREAMADPFIRISRAFFSRLGEFSSKAEERLFHKKEKVKVDKKKDIPTGGVLAGGGLAVAALGSSFAFITKTLAHLQPKTVVLALLVASALIALPAGISAYYKLSRRDLSTILEGSGWGMNTRMKLTRKQAMGFTYRPDYPSKVGPS